MDMHFKLSSTECEILLEFGRQKSLQALAEALAKDISVVSRNLKQIAEKSNVLEKQNGRWSLTQEGHSLNKWTREAIFSQNLAIHQQKHIRIGATREFSSRILIPNIRDLVGVDDISVSIISSDEGMEKLLINDQIDFGFDCGRPDDPIIAFNRVLKEPFIVVAAPKFIKKYNVKTFSDINEQSRLKFTRSENTILDLDVEASCYFGIFSDIASLRKACCLGYGWTILPSYTVKQEIKNGDLKEIFGLKIESEKFGVWWLRDRTSIKKWSTKAVKWLREQNLS